MENLKWYVLRAISGKENQVKEYIEYECSHSDLGQYVSQVLIPMEKVFQVRNGKKVVKEKVRFAGYVYVEAALSGEIASRLRFMPNVLGILDSVDNPRPLSNREVSTLLGGVDEAEEQIEEPVISYAVGETVKVNYGPFTGFSGIIEEVSVEKRKVKVNVKVFGRKTPIELGFMQVEKE